jgi:alpha-N-acetylglucosaminidase
MVAQLAVWLSIMSIQAFANAETDAAHGVLERLIGARATNFTFSIIEKENYCDVFEVSASNGTVFVKGSSGVALCHGAYKYLKKNCNAIVTWDNTSINLPKKFPDYINQRVVCPNKFTHYLNVCTFGYTMPWWKWDRWEKEIDWMALHGINMPLAMTGQEAVWKKVWKKYGMTDKNLDDFFTGPAFLPWNRMGNINKHAGPLPQSWINGQKELQKKILTREKALGMTPVVPAFAGFVPPAFAAQNPKLNILKSFGWCGFEPTLLLDPKEPIFPKIGKDFVEEYTKEFGTNHYYISDSFCEMNPTFNPKTKINDLANIGNSIYKGIALADPKGVWIMMGWPFLIDEKFWGEKEIKAMFSKVPMDKLILLDLAVENKQVWKLRKAFRERQWISCIIHNYGQIMVTYGPLPLAASIHQEIIADKKHGNHIGAGITPEGIEQNPVLYELETDALWSEAPINLKDWTDDYCQRRYGKKSKNAEKAWNLFEKSIYGFNPLDSEVIPCTIRPPAFDITLKVSSFPSNNFKNMLAGIDFLLACENELGNSDAYKRDVVDLVKQYIIFYDRVIVEAIQKAHEAKDYKRRDKLMKKYIELINDLDKLVATRPEHHLSRWINMARDWGKTKKEKDFYEYNARLILTQWGGGLTDYANKDWSGMLSGYYAPRWQIFFDGVKKSKNGKINFDEITKNRIAWENEWIKSTKPIKENPTGNELKTAKTMLKKYRNYNDFIK